MESAAVAEQGLTQKAEDRQEDQVFASKTSTEDLNLVLLLLDTIQDVGPPSGAGAGAGEQQQLGAALREYAKVEDLRQRPKGAWRGGGSLSSLAAAAVGKDGAGGSLPSKEEPLGDAVAASNAVQSLLCYMAGKAKPRGRASRLSQQGGGWKPCCSGFRGDPGRPYKVFFSSTSRGRCTLEREERKEVPPPTPLAGRSSVFRPKVLHVLGKYDVVITHPSGQNGEGSNRMSKAKGPPNMNEPPHYLAKPKQQ